MANFKPDDVARRCLCIDGVRGDVQLDEIRVFLTGMLDFHVAESGKHVFLFKDEQAAKSQLQKTPKINLTHGRAPNDTVCLNVNVCDVGDINTSWLYQNQPIKEQGTIYVNAAAAEEPLYQNPAELIANNEQTYEWDRGNNPNQYQHPMDTSATHPPPGMGPYGPGWGQYPHPSQGYPGQHGFQQPGSGQSIYSNQDGNQKNLHVPNPSQFPHGPWYGQGFPPYFPPGMGYPSPDGMHEGKDQQVPPQFNPWSWMPPPLGVQMPNTSDADPGIGHLDQQVPWFPANFGPQYSPQLQYGPTPPHESSSGSSSKDGSSVKSSVSFTTSDDCNKETKHPLSMTTKSPSKEETVSPEDVATEDQDEFPEIKKKKQEGPGGTGVVKKNEQDEPIRKIKVTKLPEETTEDTLMNYFENRRRNGGGPIENIELHPATSSAIIEFQEADAVDRVLKKAPLLFLKKQISVEEYVEEVEDAEEEEEEPSCRTIEVRGFAENTLEEVLEMYFENSKRSGGGDVTSVVIEGGVALVTFSDENTARNVSERKHVVGGCNLNVKLYEPPKRKSTQNLSRTTSEEPEESEPHCTVEVRGVTNKILDTLQLYFENTKRSGGDEIANFEYKEADEIAYITFESEDVAKRVVSHDQHKVAGQPLEVKLYIPPPPRPIYKDRVLLRGFTSKVTQDGMTNFLEAKTGLTPVKYVYGEDEGKVIITFEETIDFEKLEEACKKRPLEGSYLVPSKVHVSNSIIISNLKITTTEDMIQLYFENEKRSWGGPVEKVEFKREEEYCLVFFEDHTVCDRVLQRKHKIDGSDLHVSMYYESLGRISEYDNGPSFKPPKPLKLEGLEFAKIKFVTTSELIRTALERQLQNCFTQIQWPQTEKDCTTLTCTLTSDVQDCKKKALTWAKEAEQNLHDFLKVISVHNLDVFQEIFETVLQNLQTLTIKNPDGVALFVKKAEFSVQVVGHRAVATVVVKDIEDIIKKAEADFDRKKKQTKETLTTLKPHQLRLLLAQNYPSKMEQHFNRLKVKINLNENEIVFQGLMNDIRIAKVAMYEAVHNAAMSEVKNISEDDTGPSRIFFGLPPEILQMDKHSQQLFQDALKAGKEKVYNIRLMIVGHLGVGKTTLTKRILGEEVIEESPHVSTCGIEVHSGCCKIDHDTKKWNVENMENHISDTDQHLVNIIHKHVKYTKGEGGFGTHVKSDVPGENQNIVKPADKETERKTAHVSVKPQSSQIDSFKFTKSSPFSNKVENTAKKNKPAQSDFHRFVKKNKFLPYSDKTFSYVTILDFAGQFLFYTAHQAFMSWRTLYLLVTDITLSLDELVSGDMCQMDLSGSKQCRIREYVVYWLNSIFSHVQQQIENKGQRQEAESNYPPVILVATHMDKVPEGKREMQKEKYFDCIGRILKDRPLRYLVKGNVAISNLGQDADIDALKQKIFELAQKQGYWGEEIPATWLALEQKLMYLKRTGVPILQYKDVEKINQDSDVKIENSEELEVFLRFQHDLGNIVFYNTEKLRDKVVLDPKWLIDGVTTMMSPTDKLKVDHPDMLDQLYNFKDTGRLAKSLIGILWCESQHEELRNNQNHLLEVMEKLSIIASPVVKGDTVQNQEKYYWVPCMIHKTAPDHVKNPKPCKDMSRTSTLCFVSKTKFIHVGVFHRLVASCLSKWPAAKEGDEYHIYSGCCEFLVEDCHTLLLSLSDYVILATIFLFSSNGNEPDNNICISIKEFIHSTLSKIAACICPNSGFDMYLKCERSSPHTTEGLLEISGRNEVRCGCRTPAHCVNLDDYVQFWEKKADSAPCTPKAAERENFSRISCLLVDIGTKVLRRLLSSYTVTRTCLLPDFLKNNEKDIRDLGKKKVLTKPQLEEIFPITGTTDLRKYDISLTSALLLNLVPNLDQQVEQTIRDVRSDRNMYQAHTSSARMNSSDFSTHWTRINDNLIYLCKCCNDPDFEDDIKGEIERIKQSGLQDLQTRINKCEQNIQMLYSRGGNFDGQI